MDTGKRMRLTHPDIRRTATPVRISFDGQMLEALPGETLAATLSAAGILQYRQTASGAPRGLHCGMGACFDCLVTVDGKTSQRACLTKVRDGMVVGSAVPAGPASLAPQPTAIPDRACDLLVVGAGPAGLSAAHAAAEAGAQVVVLDERGEAGGQYLKPLASSHAHAAPDAQFRHGDALRAATLAAGAEIITGATVWGGFAADEIAALVGDAAVTFRPRRLVLAAGAHERPVPVPGWTLPGVMTTGAMQTLARANRVSPGGSVVIAGNGPLNLQLACELLAGGVRVVAVAEAAPRPGLARLREAVGILRASPDLAWDGIRYLRQLRRAGVPVIWGATILECEGDGPLHRAAAGHPGGRAADRGRCLRPQHGLPAGNRPRPRPGLPNIALSTAASAGWKPSRRRMAAPACRRSSRWAMARPSAVPGWPWHAAGWPDWRRRATLASPCRRTRPRSASLRQALAFQDGLWRLFAAPPFDIAALPDATIVCRCEEVTAGRLRAALAQAPDPSPR